MILLRSLAPYAATALLIVAGSLTMLVSALTQDRPWRSTPSGPIAGSARPLIDPQALARQLGVPRLAYWRADEDGRRRLWVSDASRSRRWSIGLPTARGEARSMRWSPDGAAVAYVAAEKELVVVRLNGEAIRLPAWRDEDSGEARRILGHAWSSDGRRVATTQRRGVGRTSSTDVFVTELDPGRWTRATTAGDVHAAEWAGPEELLVETNGGLIGMLRLGAVDAIRPLTGMSATSPRLGPDGRISFAGGSVYNEPSFTETRYAMGSIWSTTPAGDTREEIHPRQQQFRLEGRWPDGRFIVSVPGGLNLSGEGSGNLPFLAGTIRRVALAADGSSAYGITEDRILRLDIRLAGSSPAAPEAAAVVLDQVEEADVWFPRAPVTIASPPPAFSGTAGERYAFVLGGRIWMTDAHGSARAVHAAPPSAWFTLPPRWSPDGRRLLAVEAVRPGNEQRYALLLFDRVGRLTRIDADGGRRWVSSVAWSPAGDRIAVAGGAIGAWTQGEVRLLDLEGAEAGPRIPGREAAWTAGGLFVLGNGRDDERQPGTQVRVGHTLERISNGTRRTITDADRLARDPRSGFAAGSSASLNRLAASADGSHVSVFLYGVSGSGVQFFAIVGTDDGAATSFLSSEQGRGYIEYVEWSPRGALVGHTTSVWTGEAQYARSTSRAIVRDANGRILAERDGRFAGWSPDGAWFYVSRPAGLYAYRIDGSAERRVGPLGVSVATTRP